MAQPQTQQRETHESCLSCRHFEVSDSGWLPTSEALVLLPFSRSSLLKYASAGYFIQGKHWVKNGPYTGSTTLWNIDAMRQTITTWSDSEGPGT